MAESDVELIREVAELFSENWVRILGDPDEQARQLERLRPLVHADFVYHSALISGQLGFEEDYRGPEGFIKASLQFIEDFEHFSTDPEEFIDLGEGRVLLHGWNVIRTRGGDEMRFPGSAIATIEDGRLRRYETFGDRAEAERAAGVGS